MSNVLLKYQLKRRSSTGYASTLHVNATLSPSPTATVSNSVAHAGASVKEEL